jgi:PDZ domain
LPWNAAGSSPKIAARMTVMLKTSLLVLGGLVTGLAIAFWLQPSSQPTVPAATSAGDSTSALRSPVSDSRADERFAALEDALDAEILQRAALEERVAELASQIETLGGRPALAAGATDQPVDPAVLEQVRARRAARMGRDERTVVERLVAAGFAPDRAEWLNRRVEQLRMEALQEQYDARREGRPPQPGPEERSLRTELGDADYERYLSAMGRPTSIGVNGVLASSPAERSGLQPGDEIVAYGGKRVFDMTELNELTLEGTPGESVVVDVRRDGQQVQLVMPRGPIGIYGGGFRGR